MPSSELHSLTAVEQLDWLRRGEGTAVELASHYLDRIERINPMLGALTTVTPDAAHDRANRVTRELSRASALWGLPVADKDLWARVGVRTTYGSRLYEKYLPQFSDEIVHALDTTGAVSLGKTNTPEFGLSAYTESLVAPPARTPWNLELGAGGSSGGAAAAVAAGLLPIAPASDGGGSIRIPAAATGLVGLKPSRGRIPVGSGIAAFSGWVSYGSISRTVADAGLLLDALAGASSWSVAPPSWDGGPWLNAATRGEGCYQIGVMTASPWDTSHEIRIAPEASAALDVATRELDQIGHGLEETALAPEPYGEWFRVIWQTAAATIPVEGAGLDSLEPLTRWLVERGRTLSARCLAEALAWCAEYERRVISQFASFDAVLTPALATTPRPIGWYDQEDGERNFDQQVEYTPWTSFVNVAGLPAIVLPVAMTADGLPMAVQLIGRPGGEDVLLSIGAQLERRLGWQLRHPECW